MAEVKHPHKALHRFSNAFVVRSTTGRRSGGIFLALLLTVAVFAVLTRGRFLSLDSIGRLIRATAEVAILAEAVGLLMISLEFDLSAETYVALIPIISIILITRLGLGVGVAFFFSMLIGAGLGRINALIVAKSGIHSLIVTLGTMWIYRGFALLLSQGYTMTMPPGKIAFLMSGQVGHVPMPVFWLLAITVVFWFLLHHTAYGNKVYATGGNLGAARTVGINTNRIKAINFMIVALAGSLTGFMDTYYLGSLDPILGEGLALDAIAAAVIGGVSLMGGSGTIIGVLLGSFLMAVIKNGLIFLGVTAYWQSMTVGVVMLTTIIINKKLNWNQ